ncbi:MAG TPA: glycosyltransferase family 87 protein [Bacteroidales bacterium]
MIQLIKAYPTQLIFIMILVVAVILFVRSSVVPVMSDFEINLWRPTHLLLNGLSPYRTELFFDGLRPIWFPQIIGLFLPLGALPVQIASNIWFLISLVALAAQLIIFARKAGVSPVFFAASAIVIALFPSTVTYFRLGQISLLVCTFFTFLAFYHDKMKPGLLGFLLAVSLVKPQLTVIFLPVFTVILWRKNGAFVVLKTILWTILWFFLLITPLFIFYADWSSAFFRNLIENPSWAYPTLYTLTREVFTQKSLPIIITGLYLLFGIGLMLAKAKKMSEKEAMLWSLALTPVFSPVVWSWDFVFMYPLTVYLAYDHKFRVSKNIISIGFVICLVLYITMVQRGYYYDEYSMWVPIVLCLILLLSYRCRKNPAIGKATA